MIAAFIAGLLLGVLLSDQGIKGKCLKQFALLKKKVKKRKGKK